MISRILFILTCLLWILLSATAVTPILYWIITGGQWPSLEDVLNRFFPKIMN
jgi:hypothetical protein